MGIKELVGGPLSHLKVASRGAIRVSCKSKSMG
jgi:hypothetical protein